MKILLPVFLIAVLAAATGTYADHEHEDHDFHNEFDYLLMRRIEEQNEKLEKALLHLSMQVEELEKTKKKELKEQILRELTVGENFLIGAKEYLTRYQKKTNLDLFERYNIDLAVVQNEVLLKDLKDLEKKVKAIQTEDQ